jgi:hypothetical protein
MPPICLHPFRDINGNMLAFQYQQLSLQRAPQICREMNCQKPKNVKVAVQGASKKRIDNRGNCYRVQCSVNLRAGLRVLWPTLDVSGVCPLQFLHVHGMHACAVLRACRTAH